MIQHRMASDCTGRVLRRSSRDEALLASFAQRVNAGRQPVPIREPTKVSLSLVLRLLELTLLS